MISGFLWRSIGTSGHRLLAFVVLVILARLLSVQEFGTAAVASMVVLLLQPITRFGVFDFLIQKEVIDGKTRTAALILSLAFGVLLFGCMIVSAPIVAWLFSDPQLVPALRVLSLIFLFSPVSTVQESLLTKSFKFGAITRCYIGAFIPAGVAGIALAFSGYGTLSMIIQQVLFYALTAVLMWVAIPWKPVATGIASEFAPMLRLGSSYTIGQVFSSVNNNLFGLVVGIVGGTDAAGVFRVAWAGLFFCVNFTVNPILNVAQPVFAARRSEPHRLRDTYLKISRYMAALTFPVFAFLGATAPEMILLGFGDRWHAAGSALMIMSCVVVALAPNLLVRLFLNAVGRPRQSLNLAAIETALSLAFLLALAPLGMNGVAWAMVLRSWAALPVTFWMAHRYAGVEARSFVLALLPSIAASGVLAAVVFGAKTVLTGELPLPVAIAVAGGISAAAYAATLWLLDRAMATELSSLLADMRRRKE